MDSDFLPLPEGYLYRPDLALSATPLSLRTSPVHRWFYFPHSYSSSLVESILNEWALPPSARIIDPFVGAGTTLLVAKKKNYAGIGLDISPLSVFVTNTKIAAANDERIIPALDQIIDKINGAVPLSATIPMRLERALTQPELRIVMALRDQIMKEEEPIRCLFLLALLRIVREFSRAVADGGWFRWKSMPDKSENIVPRFKQQITAMLSDLAVPIHTSNEQSCYAILGDSRDSGQIKGCFDGLITSPPYPNRHDYTRIFHIELLLLGLTEEQILELRHLTMRSHVEARACNPSPDFRLPLQLSNALESFPSSADRRVPKMLRGYFEDLYLTLCAQGRIMRPKGKLAFVLGNVRHAGVLVPVDTIIAGIGEQAGLRWTGTWVIRLRGNSAQQMGRFGRIPSRESIVFFEKPNS